MKTATKTILTAMLFLLGLANANAQCTANFFWVQSAPNVINFTSTSTGTSPTTFYWWDFGDGQYDTWSNVAHTFNVPGTYNVCLTISDSSVVPACYDVYCGNITVTGTLICNLTASAYTISFATCGTCADGTLGGWATGGTAPYSYSWSPSGQTTQSATGLLPGVYTVCITDANGCTSCATDSVIVGTAGCVASFTSIINSNSVDFTSTSTGTGPTTGYYWDFGDFSYGSGTPVNHIYYALGTYNVTLLIYDSTGCSSSVTNSVTITSLTFSNCNASFWMYPDTLNPLNYIAINNTTGIPVISYVWNWGDGSPDDYTAYPTHTYTVSGTYNICLSITDGVGCTSSMCIPVTCRYATQGDLLTVPTTINVFPVGGPSSVAENNVSTSWELFPNPATETENITYTLTSSANVELSVFDLMGNKIKALENGNQNAGKHNIKWNASELSAGIYLVQLIINNEVSSKKLTVIK